MSPRPGPLPRAASGGAAAAPAAASRPPAASPAPDRPRASPVLRRASRQQHRPDRAREVVARSPRQPRRCRAAASNQCEISAISGPKLAAVPKPMTTCSADSIRTMRAERREPEADRDRQRRRRTGRPGHAAAVHRPADRRDCRARSRPSSVCRAARRRPGRRRIPACTAGMITMIAHMPTLPITAISSVMPSRIQE